MATHAEFVKAARGQHRCDGLPHSLLCRLAPKLFEEGDVLSLVGGELRGELLLHQREQTPAAPTHPQPSVKLEPRLDPQVRLVSLDRQPSPKFP